MRSSPIFVLSFTKALPSRTPNHRRDIPTLPYTYFAPPFSSAYSRQSKCLLRRESQLILSSVKKSRRVRSPISINRALNHSNSTNAHPYLEVKNEVNKDGSGKGQMTAWKVSLSCVSLASTSAKSACLADSDLLAISRQASLLRSMKKKEVGMRMKRARRTSHVRVRPRPNRKRRRRKSWSQAIRRHKVRRTKRAIPTKWTRSQKQIAARKRLARKRTRKPKREKKRSHQRRAQGEVRESVRSGVHQ